MNYTRLPLNALTENQVLAVGRVGISWASLMIPSRSSASRDGTDASDRSGKKCSHLVVDTSRLCTYRKIKNAAPLCEASLQPREIKRYSSSPGNKERAGARAQIAGLLAKRLQAMEGTESYEPDDQKQFESDFRKPPSNALHG